MKKKRSPLTFFPVIHFSLSDVMGRYRARGFLSGKFVILNLTFLVANVPRMQEIASIPARKTYILNFLG